MEPDTYDVGDDPAVVRTNRRYRTALLAVVTVACLVVSLSTAVMSVGVIRLNAIADNAREQRDSIQSCTTPGGDCYERAQQQTADAVAQIIRGFKQEEHASTRRILRAIREVFPVAAGSE